MKFYLNAVAILCFLIFTQSVFSQTDSPQQTIVFERSDAASIHYLPSGEINGELKHSFSFYAEEEDCFEGPYFTLNSDETGKKFTYLIKGNVFLVILMEEDRIVVTQSDCPEAGHQCTNWQGIYMKLEGRY